MAGEGGRRWQDEVEPELRPRLFQQLVAKMATVCRGLNKPLPERLREQAVSVENQAFNTAKNKMDYMMAMSSTMLRFQKQAQLQLATGHQQQMQMVHQIQLPNTVQAIPGGNSSFPAIPQAVPIMASPTMPHFQLPNQHMTHPFASATQINASQGPPDAIEKLYQTFNSQPAMVAPVAQTVQSGQQIMQSTAMQSHNQHPTMQLQPTNFARCHPVSMAQPQAQPIAWPNGHKTHLHRQNVYAYAPQQPTVQQQHFTITQQQVGMQRYQMLRANVVKTNDGYSGGWNNQQNIGWASGIQLQSKASKQVAPKTRQTNMESQPMPPAKRQITLNQQSNVHCPSPQNKSCDGKRKACNAEINSGQESKSCPRQSPPQTINLTADIPPFTGGQSNQQKLPVDESIGQMRQNVVTTPSIDQKPHSNQFQGVTSPCFSIKSPGAPQTLPINDVGSSCLASPIDKLRVASPNALLKSSSQSPIVKPGVVAAASPCESVKSTLASTVEKSEFLAVASPFAMVKSASPSATVNSGIVPAPSSSESESSFMLHKNAAVNGCNQTTPTKLLTPDPPCQTQTPAGQAEDQEHGGAETLMTKKPIDRLIAAVLSSSPAVLLSSVNSIESALSEINSVPLRMRSSSKRKHFYDITLPSESPTLGSMDGSSSMNGSIVTFEFDASDSASSRYCSVKRQKTQNVKDALLDEIEAVNSRLIDTVISITSDDREDGITSCNGVTLIKLSYTAVSLAPSLKSHFTTSVNPQPLMMPMTLLIPADYPRSSPVIVDDERNAQLRTKLSCISSAVDAAFRHALRNLQEPRSLKETAMVWDSCVRRAITEYADRLGGGTLSSSLGRCEGWVGA